jgi:chemotaxis signal transduction protein
MNAVIQTPVRQAQHLLFSLGHLRCWLELTRLEAIVPWVTLQTNSANEGHANPEGWLGRMEYRGKSVPVVDSERLLLGSATEPHLGSRVLLLFCSARLVGVLVSDAVSIGYAADLSMQDVEHFDPCDVLGAMLSAVPA